MVNDGFNGISMVNIWSIMVNIWLMMVNNNLVGGIPTPLNKYESQLGLLFPIYGKINNVPDHQPGIENNFGTKKITNIKTKQDQNMTSTDSQHSWICWSPQTCDLPSGKLTVCEVENGQWVSWLTCLNWWFSIIMLVLPSFSQVSTSYWNNFYNKYDHNRFWSY